MGEKQSLLVLGCGNMAQALVKGLYQANNQWQIYTYTPTKLRAQQLADEVNGQVIADLSDIPQTRFVMLACKPQQLPDLAPHLKGKLGKDTVVISILAGVSVSQIQQALAVKALVRVMPNTPSMVSAGVNAFYFDPEVNEQAKQAVLVDFKSFSEVFVFDKESDIDVITPYSGSGPAYIFEWARIMIEHLSSQGIDADDAQRMVKATFFGAAKLLNESSDDPETLRNKVTSKGGVTFEALQVFRRMNLEQITVKALDAAYNRTLELAKDS